MLTLETHAGSLSGVSQAPAPWAQFGDSAEARALQPNWLPDSAVGVDFFNRSGPAYDRGAAKNTTDVVCRWRRGRSLGTYRRGVNTGPAGSTRSLLEVRPG